MHCKSLLICLRPDNIILHILEKKSSKYMYCLIGTNLSWELIRKRFISTKFFRVVI